MDSPEGFSPQEEEQKKPPVVPDRMDPTPEAFGSMVKASVSIEKARELSLTEAVENRHITDTLRANSSELVENLLDAYNNNYGDVKTYLVNQYERVKESHEAGTTTDDQLKVMRRLFQSAHGKVAYRAALSFSLEEEKKLSAVEASQQAAALTKEFGSNEKYLAQATELRRAFNERLSEKRETARTGLMDRLRKILPSPTSHDIPRRPMVLHRIAVRSLMVSAGLLLASRVAPSHLDSVYADIIDSAPSAPYQELSTAEVAVLRGEPVPKDTQLSSEAEQSPVQSPLLEKALGQDEHNPESTPPIPDQQETEPEQVQESNEEELVESEEASDNKETVEETESTEISFEQQLQEYSLSHPDLNQQMIRAVKMKEGIDGITLDQIPELYKVSPETVMEFIHAVEKHFGDLPADLQDDIIVLGLFETGFNPESVNANEFAGIIQVWWRHLANDPRFQGASQKDIVEALKNIDLNLETARRVFDQREARGKNGLGAWHPRISYPNAFNN